MNRKSHMIRELAFSIFSEGIISFFRNRNESISYWRNIARAAVQPPETKMGKYLGLPQSSLNDIVPDIDSIPVSLIDYRYDYGNMPIHELMILCKIVRNRRPSLIFEIGTFMGNTTLQIAANSQAYIYTLDLPPLGHNDHNKPQILDPMSDVYPNIPGIRFHGTSYADRIHQLFGDSQTFDFAPYYGRIDFILIDAFHHYEFVLRDSLNAIRMISPNGVIVWHDYASYAPGVVRALNELNNKFPLRHIIGTSFAIYIA